MNQESCLRRIVIMFVTMTCGKVDRSAASSHTAAMWALAVRVKQPYRCFVQVEAQDALARGAFASDVVVQLPDRFGFRLMQFWQFR